MAGDKKIPTSASGAVSEKTEGPTTVLRANSSFTNVDRNERRLRGFLSKYPPRELYEVIVTVKPLGPHMIAAEITASLPASCIRALRAHCQGKISHSDERTTI